MKSYRRSPTDSLLTRYLWTHLVGPHYKLDVSKGRRHLKSAQLLFYTSAHPTMHGQLPNDHGHKWLIQISPIPCQSALPFLRLGYFKLWLWKFKVNVMGMVKAGQGHTVGPVSNWFVSLSLPINQTNNCWDTAISKFDLDNLTMKIQG